MLEWVRVAMKEYCKQGRSGLSTAEEQVRVPRELEKGDFLPALASIFMQEVAVELDWEMSKIESYGDFWEGEAFQVGKVS